jgi:hypothetical protein
VLINKANLKFVTGEGSLTHSLIHPSSAEEGIQHEEENKEKLKGTTGTDYCH